MSRITLSKIINTQALRELDGGNGKWLDEQFRVRTMSRFWRICMRYAPRLFMPRQNKAAVRRLYKNLSSYQISRKPMGPKRAALLLAKAGLVDIVKKGKRLDIKPKALLDKQKLDTMIESSDKNDDVLMDEISSPLPTELLGQKRRRSPGLSRTDSIEGPTPAKQKKTSTTEPQPVIGQTPRHPLKERDNIPSPPPGMSPLPRSVPDKENSRPLPNVPSGQRPTEKMDTTPPPVENRGTGHHRKRKNMPSPTTREEPSVSIQRKIAIPPKNRRRNKTRPLEPLSSPRVMSPPLRPVPQSEEITPIFQQVASQTDEVSRYEDKLFGRVKGRYCQNPEQYAVLRNAFFSLNDFEKELNDEDFVKLVTNGTLYEFNEDLLLSWEDDHYRREAAEIMVKLGKRTAPLPTAPAPMPAPVTKKTVPYAFWCARENSFDPLVYALRVTKSDTRVEDGFIKEVLTSYVADKLQSDFNMTVDESAPAARALLQDLGLKPGDEKTATYGQISSINARIKVVGGKHLEKRPRVTVKQPPAPKLASELPQKIQDSPEHARVYEQVRKEKLVDKAEFIALYETLDPRVLTNDLFPYQLAAYNWLKSSGEFSREDFVKGIQQGLFNSGITTQLLKTKDAKEEPVNWSKKVKDSFYPPPAAARPTTQPVVDTPVNQPETRARRQAREHINAVEMRPEAHPSPAARLPALQYLMNRKGMPNFGCTCYFNSVCQQLSLAIPPETMTALATKQIPDKYAATVRDEFINLMNLVNGEYPDVKTRQQHQALEQRFATAQARLFNACHQHGQHVPGSRFRATMPHNRLEQLDQEDSSEFFVAISDALKLNDHLSSSLQEATHISLREGGKTYTYRKDPNVADTLQQVKLPDEVDEGKMNWQSCVHAMKDTMPLYREWSENEAREAGHPNPKALNNMKRNSTRDIVKVSADVSQLRSLTLHSNLTDGYYDKQTKRYTNRKLTERGRRVLADGATRVKQPVSDLKTGKTVEVDLNLQSVVVHQGNSLRSGHYTTIVRSQEGPWVLFNDRQPVAQYQSLNAYLAEDKSRTPYLLNYQVAEPARS